MLTDKECKKILESNGEKLTNEEAQKIRQLMMDFAALTVNEFKKRRNGKSSDNGARVE